MDNHWCNRQIVRKFLTIGHTEDKGRLIRILSCNGVETLSSAECDNCNLNKTYLKLFGRIWLRMTGGLFDGKGMKVIEGGLGV